MEALVAQLDGLPEDASHEGFLNRVPMMELLALADRAMPALGRALSSGSWSIRASALYIIASHGDEGAAQIAIQNFLRDPHPAVRAIAASWTGPHVADHIIGEATEERLYMDRWGLRLGGQSLDWLPESYYWRRLERYSELLTGEGGFERSAESSGSDQATVKASVSSGMEVFSRELTGPRAHHVASRLLAMAHRASDDDVLAVLLEVATTVPNHDDQSQQSHCPCNLVTEFYGDLCTIIENRVWASMNFQLLDRGLWLLDVLAARGYEPARLLLGKFANEHANATIRERVARTIHNRSEARGSALQLARERSIRDAAAAAHANSRTEVPSDRPSQPPAGRDRAPAPGADDAAKRPWVIVIFLGTLALIVSAIALIRRRKRSTAQ